MTEGKREAARMHMKQVMTLVLSLVGLSPTSSLADTSFQQTLFSCSFGEGENSVQVLYFPQGEDLVYAYANTQGHLELNLNASVQAVDYAPFSWDHGDITERVTFYNGCLLYTSPSPRDLSTARMPSSA